MKALAGLILVQRDLVEEINQNCFACTLPPLNRLLQCVVALC